MKTASTIRVSELFRSESPIPCKRSSADTSQASRATRKAFQNPFDMRIFGDELLEESGKRAIAWRTIIVAATAFIDGLAWGATGYESAGIVGALIMGLIAGIFVYIADAAYLTADSSSEEHRSDSKEEKTKRRIKRAHIALVFRVGLAVGSTVISGPSLISLVMHSDVNNELLKQATNARADQRAKLFAPTDEMNTLKSEINNLSVAISTEIQGGVKGRGGTCGPVCRDEKAQQGELQSKYDALESKLKAPESTFDALSDKWIGDRVKNAGPAERRDALGVIKNTPGYKAKRITVTGMIWLLLAVIVILKLLEPIEIKLYYSRWMQAMWPTFHSTMGISALSFYRRVKAGYWRLSHLLERMNELKLKLEEELERSRELAQKRAEAQSRVDDLRLQCEKAESVITQGQRLLEKVGMSSSTGLAVENWSRQIDSAKGDSEKVKRLLPPEEQTLARLERDTQLRERAVSRLQAEEDRVQDDIDTTRRRIDQHSTTDLPAEWPA